MNTVLETLENRQHTVRHKLIQNMTWLAEHLNCVVSMMEKDENKWFNTLGEVQAIGGTIDNQCGQLGELRNAIDLIKQEENNE